MNVNKATCYFRVSLNNNTLQLQTRDMEINLKLTPTETIHIYKVALDVNAVNSGTSKFMSIGKRALIIFSSYI